MQKQTSAQPDRRPGRTADGAADKGRHVAVAIPFPASEAVGGMTGSIVAVDCGQTIW